MSDEARQCPVTPRKTFNAYYYSLEATGNDKVDAILEAVARAGKMYHNTADWDEESGVVAAIQKAANEAADWLEKPAPAATCGDCGVILPCKPYEHREGCSNAASEPTRAAEDLAQKFHETYERLAPIFGYETRRESAKPWTEVPEQNRKLMTAVCAELIAPRPAPPTAQARSFSDAHISRAVEIYCKVLDEDRGGTGAYLHMGTSGAMRAALESLGVDARDTTQARPTREQVDGAIVRGWCAHSFEDPLRQIFTSIADEIMKLLEDR